MMKIDVGDVVRLPNYETAGGWRLWYVTAHRMGGLHQESVWELLPLDVGPGSPALCQVPAVMLETHPGIEVIDGEWFREKLVGFGIGPQDTSSNLEPS